MRNYETLITMDELSVAFYGQEFIEIPKRSIDLLECARDMERQGLIEFIAKTKIGYIFRSIAA